MVIKKITSIRFELGTNQSYRITLNDTIPEDGEYKIEVPFENKRHLARILSKEAAILWLEIDNILCNMILGETEENKEQSNNQ